MAGVWKRDGTIAVTKGSKKVVGTGTTFADPKNAAAKGHLLVMVTGTAVDLYEVDYSESNSVFYLVEAYRGDTGTGKAYAIDTSRTDSIPEFARRLNATLGAYQQQSDAFQALLTSSAATVEVTAPDGTKQTLIPWKRVTSEGEGQAARAKSEADKAAASAALAGGIVEASALPLPDVWAPLSDSLRMITGYGRDVLVGSDVVARMVNFSRSTTATYIGKDGQLKTAAANEPRFEKEGLLLEGQSTNLAPQSDDVSKWTMVNTYVLDGVINGLTNTAGIQTRIEYPNVIPIGASGYTVTIEYDPSQSMGVCQVRLGGAESGWLESSEVGVFEDLTRKLVRTRTSDGWIRVCVTSKLPADEGLVRVNFAPKGHNATSAPTAGLTAKVRRVQVEARPFASSYIPTAGAAVTRAADIATIPQARNIPDLLGSSYSIAARFTLKPGVSKSYRFLFRTGNTLEESMGIAQVNSGTKLKAYQGSADPVNNFIWIPFVEGSSFVCGLGIRSGKLVGYSSMDRGVVANTSTFTPNSNQSDFLLGDLRLMGNYQGGNEAWGHIRDVRIWWQALSDEQWKVVS